MTGRAESGGGPCAGPAGAARRPKDPAASGPPGSPGASSSGRGRAGGPPSKGAVRNRTIFTGDNLRVMRGMEPGSVDLIYLDPPFNSKHDYAAPIGTPSDGAEFKDTWTLKDVDLSWWGEIADEHPALYRILGAAKETAGRSMMSYLIYMAIRIIEMRRILKDTGSLYLHCDPTAGHYLKLVLDSIFGSGCFRNEIVWNRARGISSISKNFRKSHDLLFRYSKSDTYSFANQYMEKDEKYAKLFPYTDRHGRHSRAKILGPGVVKGGETGKPWRGIDPNKSKAHWIYTRDKLDRLDREGRIYWPKKKGGLPRLKYYLHEASGPKVSDVWADIGAIESNSRERVGYPTQKPLALLERVISASSNEGDVVLDPFCGCATACHAAERLGRRWIGIDISEKAAQLVQMRINRDITVAGAGGVIHRTDIPYRKARRTPCVKDFLYGKQEGDCAGHCFQFVG